ncbi:MAG TPA: hypothetical protein VD903_18260 [Pseudonocardia sp.]|nr:hypothetical protein [Pseudonocardia sp.]
MEGERAESGNQLARRPGTRLAAAAAVWAFATLIGLGVAATTRIGPTLFAVSTNHGVHLGDVVAFAVAYGAALVLTLRLASRARSRPTQPETAHASRRRGA